jgi:biopolymer transport protein ExbD
MAQLDSAPSTKKNGKKNLSAIKIDLTPMVDLGFLLITFFIFTTTMQRPSSMKIIMPTDEATPHPTVIPESGALTLIPIDNNKMAYFKGQYQQHLDTFDSKQALRNYLVNMKQHVNENSNLKNKEIFVIIKPCNQSKYGNLINILDELLITEIEKYAICELSAAEKIAYKL